MLLKIWISISTSMKEVKLEDLSFNVGVLRSMSLVVNLGQKQELERIANELKQYITQQIERRVYE